ncbi:TetR/AcrR family transcriptional regulator [Streptomyces sp. SID12488]|uniref:TetR family transcriptional regulator n=1 Tax=Streptomyces sp. SID12488 TaxID=2706040 RepID=UPI0013DD66F9|nr:TetR/AcrR family transcriptional regulator [Streptomyces sp. SID12488]NEA68041.1 TetR family transcriptional regulator [Streptomyces sp. SID12488]
MAGTGLRERKKQQTYQNVSDIAIGLFLAKGFDAVSVAEVAAAAGISKPTLFRYFPAKEDLVLHRFADHEDEAARVVRAVGAGTGVATGAREGAGAEASPLDALRRHFLDGLSREDPVTGLNGSPEVLAFHRLLYGTASLVARAYEYQQRSEAVLAVALGDTLAARLAAGQIIAVQRILAQENWRRIAAGETVEAVREDAVAAAEGAFGQLAAGLPWLGVPGGGAGAEPSAGEATR